MAGQAGEQGLRLGRSVVQGLLVDQVVEGFGVAGPDLERPPVARRGLAEFALPVQRVGQVVEGARIPGPQLQHAARAGGGVVQTLQTAPGCAQVQPGVRIGGGYGDGALVGRGGARQVALPEGGVPRLEACGGFSRSRVADLGRHVALHPGVGWRTALPLPSRAAAISLGFLLPSPMRKQPVERRRGFWASPWCVRSLAGLTRFRPSAIVCNAKAINDTNHKVASLGGTNRHLECEV